MYFASRSVATVCGVSAGGGRLSIWMIPVGNQLFPGGWLDASPTVMAMGRIRYWGAPGMGMSRKCVVCESVDVPAVSVA